MLKLRLLLCFILLTVLTGCGLSPAGLPQTTPQPTLDAAVAGRLPEVQAAAQAYLEAWKAEDYPSMYAKLTSISQAALNQEEFTRHYEGVAKEVVLNGVDYEILAALVDQEQAQVSYQVKLKSALVGDIQAETRMNLTQEKGEWRVQWDDTLVLPYLQGSNYLSMDRQGHLPSRSNIYDRTGQALVTQADATAIGLYPDQIDPAQAEQLYSILSELTGKRAETIQALHANFPVGAGWYLPLGEVPADQVASRFELLSGLSGLVLEPYKARYYYNGIAPHVVGYMGQIPDSRRKNGRSTT